jgi:antitoxin (DNA-binding transcriptional repressor) of toxin-antitoxin stability system
VTLEVTLRAGVGQVKRHLSAYIAYLHEGSVQRIVVTSHGRPVAVIRLPEEESDEQ